MGLRICLNRCIECGCKFLFDRLSSWLKVGLIFRYQPRRIMIYKAGSQTGAKSIIVAPNSRTLPFIATSAVRIVGARMNPVNTVLFATSSCSASRTPGTMPLMMTRIVFASLSVTVRP